MSVAVILVAAGRGERLGAGAPKALVRVAGTTLLEHAISRALGTENLSQLVITATPGHLDEFLARSTDNGSVCPFEWSTSSSSRTGTPNLNGKD